MKAAETLKTCQHLKIYKTHITSGTHIWRNQPGSYNRIIIVNDSLFMCEVGVILAS